MNTHCTNAPTVPLSIFHAFLQMTLKLPLGSTVPPSQLYLHLKDSEFSHLVTYDRSFITSPSKARKNLLQIAHATNIEPTPSISQQILSVQNNRNEFMHNQGLFFDKNNGTLIVYAPHSHSGIVRTLPFPNTYLCLHYDGNIWHFFIGAAQGASENSSLSKEQKAEQYQEKALYQSALGVIGGIITHRLNGIERPYIPLWIMISNYLSHSSGYFSDPLMINERTQALKGFFENNISSDKIEAMIDYIAPGTFPNALGSAPSSVAFFFNQHGTNIDRFIAKHTCLESFITPASQHMRADDTLSHNILTALKESKRGSSLKQFFYDMPVLKNILKPIAQRFCMLSVWIGRFTPPFFSLHHNNVLHREALKIILVERLGGISIGGCKSAKDRFGAVRLIAQSYLKYIQQYKEIPPSIGTLSYYRLPYSKRLYLDRMLSESYISGHMLFIGHSNTPGACGIKNNFWVLAGRHRQILESALTQKIAENPSDLTLPLLRMKPSYELSMLNKFYQDT